MDLLNRWIYAPRDPAEPIPFSAKVFNVVVILVAVAFVFVLSFRAQNAVLNWTAVWEYRTLFLVGLGNTLLISVFTLLLALPIGVTGAVAQRSRILPLRYATKTYVELIRGTPLLAQILLIYYVLFPAIHLDDKFLAGVLILSFFNGAYITEIIRGGIESVGQTQVESARAIGLTSFQSYRYVVLPQALRYSVPALAGQFVSMVKDSSLLSAISVAELTFQSKQASTYTYSTYECYIIMTAGYLLITMPLGALARWLEKKLAYES